MKTLIGALALAFAVPAAAQSAPAADPHAGHAQHQQQTANAPAQHGGADHARMMEKCKDPNASAEMKAHCAEMKAHCAEMMKKHGQHQAAPAQSQAPHAQHAH